MNRPPKIPAGPTTRRRARLERRKAEAVHAEDIFGPRSHPVRGSFDPSVIPSRLDTRLPAGEAAKAYQACVAKPVSSPATELAAAGDAAFRQPFGRRAA